MYSKLAFFVVSAFTLGALAAPADPAAAGAPPPPPPPANQCNGGTMTCCQSVQSATSSPVQTLAGLLGIPIGSLSGLVGLTCNPIVAVAGGGTNCVSQVACCEGNTFKGAITLGCTPINIGL